jgi:hypothetical protein
MTIAQLIHQLSQYPPDSLVLMTDPRGGLRTIVPPKAEVVGCVIIA